MKTLLVGGSLVILSGLSGCDDTAEGVAADARDVAQTVEQGADRAGREISSEVEEFRRESRTQLRNIEQRLETLEARSEAAGERASAEAQKELSELRAEKRKLEGELDRFSANTKAEFQESKRQFDRSLAELGRSADTALDELGDEVREAVN